MSAYVVETAALRENIRTLRDMLAPQTVFWAVVKGDGYGLGAEPLCRVLLEEGIDHFAATTLAEAQTVRALSAGAEILMLQPSCLSPGLLEQLVQLGAVLTVSSMEDAAVLGAVAQNLGLTAGRTAKLTPVWAAMAFTRTSCSRSWRCMPRRILRSAAFTPIFPARFAARRRHSGSLPPLKR